MNLADWLPQSRLVLPRTDVPLPSCPRSTRTTTSGAGSASGTTGWDSIRPRSCAAWSARGRSRTSVKLLATMDEAGVEAIVNLDGLWGDELERNLDRYDRAHPGRFATFCHVDLRAIGRPGFDAEELVASLRRSRDAGARGLKIWKDLGLGHPRRERRARASRRPAARTGLRGRRRARPAGAHPHRRSRGLLRACGRRATNASRSSPTGPSGAITAAISRRSRA